MKKCSICRGTGYDIQCAACSGLGFRDGAGSCASCSGTGVDEQLAHAVALIDTARQSVVVDQLRLDVTDLGRRVIELAGFLRRRARSRRGGRPRHENPSREALRKRAQRERKRLAAKSPTAELAELADSASELVRELARLDATPRKGEARQSDAPAGGSS